MALDFSSGGELVGAPDFSSGGELIGYGAGAGRGSVNQPKGTNEFARGNASRGPTQGIIASAQAAQDAPDSGVYGADDAWGAITSAGQKKESVLEGMTIPEAPFNPAEAEKLERRDYAQSTQYGSATPWDGKSGTLSTPVSSGSKVQDFAANALGGATDTELALSKMYADAFGMDDQSYALKKAREALAGWQATQGSDTLVGKVGHMAGAVAPALLTGGGLATDALLFASPMANDAYQGARDSGKSEDEARADAGVAFAFGLGMPFASGKIGHVATAGMEKAGANALTHEAASAAVGAGSFAGLGSAQRATQSAVDQAFGSASAPHDPDQTTAEAITGALMHFAPRVAQVAGTKAADAYYTRVDPTQQAARELSRNIDAYDPGQPNIRPVSINPNLANAQSVDEAIAAATQSVPSINPLAVTKQGESNVADTLSKIRAVDQTRQDQIAKDEFDGLNSKVQSGEALDVNEQQRYDGLRGRFGQPENLRNGASLDGGGEGAGSAADIAGVEQSLGGANDSGAKALPEQSTGVLASADGDAGRLRFQEAFDRAKAERKQKLIDRYGITDAEADARVANEFGTFNDAGVHGEDRTRGENIVSLISSVTGLPPEQFHLVNDKAQDNGLSFIEGGKAHTVINLGDPTMPVSSTGWHEVLHSLKRTAAIDTKNGLTNTPAQRFSDRIDNLLSEFTLAGKQEYVREFLHKSDVMAASDAALAEGQKQGLQGADLAAFVKKAADAEVKKHVGSDLTHEEMQADLMGKLMNDPDFVNRIAAKDPIGFKKFAQDWLKFLSDMIANAKKNFLGSGGNAQSRKIDQHVQSIERAKDIVEDALLSLRNPVQMREHSDGTVSFHGADHEAIADALRGSGVQQMTVMPDGVRVGKTESPYAKDLHDSGVMLSRKQTPEEIDAALTAKWERLGRLKEHHPSILDRFDTDANSGNEAAAVMRLISRTGFRIGGDGLTDGLPTYGASNLKPEHVTINGDTVSFNFRGKSGVQQVHHFIDPQLAKDLQARMGGDRLFNVADRSVRRYHDKVLSDMFGDSDYKVHDYRSYIANDAAQRIVESLPAPKNAEELKQAIRLASEEAGRKIGDDHATALKHYIDSRIFDKWREGIGESGVQESSGKSKAGIKEAGNKAADAGQNDSSVRRSEKDFDELGAFNLDHYDVTDKDYHLTDAEVAAKIKAELADEMYGVKEAKPAPLGAKTVDLGSVKDKDIKSAGLHPENVYPDLEYQPHTNGGKFARFKVNGTEYLANVKDTISPVLSNPETGNSPVRDMNRAARGQALPHGMQKMTEQAKMDWNKRFAAQADLLRRRFDLYTAVPGEARSRVADVWNKIAKNPDAFEFTKDIKPSGKNTVEVAQSIADKFAGRYEINASKLGPDEATWYGDGVTLRITDTKTGAVSKAVIQYDPREREVVMHTQDLEKGSGAGKPVYQIGQEFANAFRSQIKADPQGLLGVNNYRRTEQMFSGMLRSGKPETMQPGIGQRIYGWNERATKPEHHERNMVRTALAIARNVAEFFPQIKDIRYDMASGKFVHNDGSSAESIVKGVLDSPDARAMSLSRSTLARAAITHEAIAGDVNVPDKIDTPVLYSRKEDDVSPIGFYSALKRGVDGINASANPPSGWKDAIRGLINKGVVKADEVEWTGLNDWLDMQQGKVTKQQVQEFLQSNGVQVHETQLGNKKGFTQEMQERLDELEQNVDRTDAEDAEFQRLIRAENDASDATGNTNQTKYSQYTLPGGENYREVLLTLPSGRDKINAQLANANRAWRDAVEEYGQGSEQAKTAKRERDSLSKAFDAETNYKSNHWDQPNVLAHIRVNDRTDADGKRVLFVEELQSDWGQDGKKRGFASPETERMSGTVAEDGFGGWKVNWEDGTFSGGYGSKEQAQAKADEGKSNAKTGLPPAPFVTKTEGWLNLALKRVIKMAVDEGYDRVAFVNGKQSVERYDLSKSISSVEYHRDPSTGDGLLSAFGHDDDIVIHSKPVTDQTLEDHIGKEAAQKLLDSKPKKVAGGADLHRLNGDGLKVGGEGMTTFYDSIVPNAVKKLLPKLGGDKLITSSLEAKKSEIFFEKAPKWGGYNVGDRTTGSWLTDEGWVKDKSEAYRYDKSSANRVLKRFAKKEDGSTQQTGFDITDKMRQTAEDGLPMFARKEGPTEKSEEDNYLVPEVEGHFNDGSGKVAQMPSIIFARDGIKREYATMPIRIRVGHHNDDQSQKFAQAGVEHRIGRRNEDPNRRGYDTPKLGDGSANEVERATRDITRGILSASTVYADNDANQVYLFSPEMQRMTVMQVQRDSEGKKFWSVVTSQPSTLADMSSKFSAPTSATGITVGGERTQQAFNIKREILKTLKESVISPVSSESYSINQYGKVRKNVDTSSVVVTQKKAPVVLQRGADGKIILNKNKIQPSEEPVQRSRKEEESPKFKAWSHNLPVVHDGAAGYEGGAAVFSAFHGTTHSDISIFKRQGSKEGFLGDGPYFTTTASDASENYAGVGPDLTSRIARESDQIWQNFEDDNWYARDVLRDYFEAHEPSINVDDFDGRKFDALKDAYAELAIKHAATMALKGDSEGLMMKVYVRLDNPADTTGRSKDLTYEREENEDGDVINESGTLVDWIDAARTVADQYGIDIDRHIQDITEDGESIGMDQVFNSALKRFTDAYDDNGEILSSGAIFKEIAEEAGYDGVIMDADLHFGSGKRGFGGIKLKGMNGIAGDTLHIVPFKSTQIKSATGNNGEFNPEDSDIRHSLRQRFDDAANTVSDLIDDKLGKSGIYGMVAPMSGGSERARAIAQQWINNSRRAEYQWHQIDKFLTENFTEAQRMKMFNAADEQNELLSTGQSTAGKGLDTLAPDERQAMDMMHKYGEELLQRAKDVGMFKGDGVPYWTPRMMAMVDPASGDFVSGSGKTDSSSNGTGRNFTTSSSNLKQRKYLTADETEAAMAKMGGMLVRDIRTMPLAMAKLEKAIAGRELVNQIKDIGYAVGEDFAVTHEKEGYFTLDHPAFQTFKPRLQEVNGKWETVKDQDGNIIFDKHPIYISKEFEGPLKAILSEKSSDLYKAFMLLKSKSMSAIMFSPMIHQLVIAGRAFAYAGLKLPALYVKGAAVRRDTGFMKEMIGAGMVPIGGQHQMLDVGDIARGIGKEGGWLDPNESWIGLGAQKIGNTIKGGLGDKVKSGIDVAGDFWHNTLLWNRVGDLQAGIAKDVYSTLLKKGADEETAKIVAAHIANRYSGAVGRENMSSAMHRFLNVLLFSKSFNMGNIGSVKDVLYGLPSGLKATLVSNASGSAAKIGMSYAKRKAMTGLALDFAATIIATSLVQDWWKRNKDSDWKTQLSEGLTGYQKRAADMWLNLKDHPLSMTAYNPYRLSSTWANEPDKRDRVDMGAQPNSGRHEYMRLPTGKVVEDIYGWAMHPAETLGKKLSPAAGAVKSLVTNDKTGYGTPVYDPDDSMIHKAMDVAKFLASKQLPADQLITAKDVASGVGTQLDKDKLAGNMTGFTVSQGHPRGPEGAVNQKTEDRMNASKKYALEEVKRDLKYGDEDAARARLEKLQYTPKEVNLIIRNLQNPKDGLSAQQRKKFNAHANESERADMDLVR